jgi:hypothetical protein
VRDIKLKRDGRGVRLTLRAAEDCERELAAVERNRGLFEETFDCELTVAQGAPA